MIPVHSSDPLRLLRGTPGEYRIFSVQTLVWKNCAGSHENTERTVDGRQGQEEVRTASQYLWRKRARLPERI